MSANDRQFCLSSGVIAIITGCPIANVQLYWTIIFKALQDQGLSDRLVVIAVVATIAVEDPEFKPVEELGGDAYFTRLYENRRDLGNHFPGDGARFHGRGFIQLTGRTNYCLFGKLLGVDLVHQPELALNPVVAARILALYFKLNHVAEAARQENWKQVRLLVNGGLNNFTRFISIVQRLLVYLPE